MQASQRQQRTLQDASRTVLKQEVREKSTMQRCVRHDTMKEQLCEADDAATCSR